MSKGSGDRIHFHYLVKPFLFKNRNGLKQYILTLIGKEGKKVDTINYIFCTDEYLSEINTEYLKHNSYTDIITFDLSTNKEEILADIYMSVDRVRENAGLFKTTFSKELHRVIFHGALHLVGYKDKSATQNEQMREKEDHYLKAYFISRDTVS